MRNSKARTQEMSSHNMQKASSMLHGCINFFIQVHCIPQTNVSYSTKKANVKLLTQICTSSRVNHESHALMSDTRNRKLKH